MNTEVTIRKVNFEYNAKFEKYFIAKINQYTVYMQQNTISMNIKILLLNAALCP